MGASEASLHTKWMYTKCILHVKQCTSMLFLRIVFSQEEICAIKKTTIVSFVQPTIWCTNNISMFFFNKDQHQIMKILWQHWKRCWIYFRKYLMSWTRFHKLYIKTYLLEKHDFSSVTKVETFCSYILTLKCAFHYTLVTQNTQ